MTAPSRRGSAPPAQPASLRVIAEPTGLLGKINSMPQRAQALHQRVMITIVGSVDLGILTAEVSVRRVRGAEIDQETACCGFRPQSSIATSVFTTNWMIMEPPGEPSTAYSAPRPADE